MSLHEAANKPLAAEMCVLGIAARDAARALRETSTEAKNAALLAAAAAIRARSADILAANAEDMMLAKMEGLSPALLDRLALDEARVEAIAQSLEEVAALPDPVGRELARWTRPNGLEIARLATKGISAAALAKAVRQAVTSEINTRKTMSGQASRLGAGEVIVGDVNYSRQYFERLSVLTPADLRRVMHSLHGPHTRNDLRLTQEGGAWRGETVPAPDLAPRR